MKKSFFYPLLLLSAIAGFSQNKTSTMTGKKVIVYTTAGSTNYRITQTNTLTFTNLPQPVETQVCIFVDLTKRFKLYEHWRRHY